MIRWREKLFLNVDIVKKFSTNKALEMRIFQVHERRGKKVDEINVD